MSRSKWKVQSDTGFGLYGVSLDIQTTRLNKLTAPACYVSETIMQRKRNEKKRTERQTLGKAKIGNAHISRGVRGESNKSENNLNACVAIKSKISDKIYCPRCFRFNIFFTEFENIGIGAKDGARRKWVKQLCDAEMLVDFVKFCFHLVKQAVLPVIALAKCFLSNNKENELNK